MSALSVSRQQTRAHRIRVKIALLADLRRCRAPYQVIRTEQVHLACLRRDVVYDGRFGRALFEKWVLPLAQ